LILGKQFSISLFSNMPAGHFPGAADNLRQLVRMPYNCLHLKRKQDAMMGVPDSQGGVNGDKRMA